MSIKNCYLCNGRKFKAREGTVRDNTNLKVLECDRCGLVFLSSFDHIEKGFYENSGMHNGQIKDIENLARMTNPDSERRLTFITSTIKGKSLLDFGCGTGDFLSKAKSVAVKANGLEPEIKLQEIFRKRSLNVYRTLSDIPEGEKYDVITLFHVLEHLPDPKGILLKLAGFLAKDGQIVIEVPNADDVLLTLYKSKAFSEFTYWSCHLFLFNLKTIQEVAHQIGLKINYIKQVQRYSLANHLYWLAEEKPNGHNVWKELDNIELNKVYEAKLRELGKCDTVIISLSIPVEEELKA